MTDKLRLFNNALTRHLRERKLASLADDAEARHFLDDAWVGAIDYCLSQGDWNFATRTTKMDYSPSLEPNFGFNRAFAQPDDFIKTSMISADENFYNPLLHYRDENGWWYTDVDSIYVSYVSNDVSYGGDMSLWPETFQRFIEAYLAQSVMNALRKGTDDCTRIEKSYQKLLLDARSKDAQANPTQFFPRGSWLRSRTRRDFGRPRTGSGG